MHGKIKYENLSILQTEPHDINVLDKKHWYCLRRQKICSWFWVSQNSGYLKQTPAKKL